ncbi:HAMP domain-containing histidine kinase [Sulfurovum sp. XGS-02]|uniref:sensor histidine kinase n=1 Tax=Sulfurovum sp. XGS-02 TaxID=2925411 RepID=UPI0020633B4C|nr:HAMP domain-containing sensor histidine kinase [Sulfurovum sp. XGS-02]UPT77966.1 HAMP domain-containing histidine kinase [Sulfurovum sp. XGS-02]
MIFNTDDFARKYAFIYTGILAVLLIAPLVVYVQLLLQIDEAKVKLSLESQAKKIITSMQHYQNEDQVYHFPRYKEYKAALYTDQYEVIFSNLEFEPLSFTEGFHQKRNRYYYVYPLPNAYYFGANYLLVSTVHTANNIYFFAAMVMIAIVIALFIFSFLLLRNFSRPFEKLNMQLDNFIKDSMHEINTPLSIINLNSDLFASKYGENKYLLRMKSAAKTLATIYNDMDYLVKEGRVKYKKSDLDFGEFIQNRVDYFQEIANLKQIQLHTNILPGLIHTFSKTKLQRIVDNTISNAIKYSNDNSDVEVSVYKKDAHIVFEVIDHGVGIKDTSKIFSRYYRENEAKGGFGIGLNIVKKIIDEEDILLEVNSKFGEGTTFKYIF